MKKIAIIIAGYCLIAGYGFCGDDATQPLQDTVEAASDSMDAEFEAIIEKMEKEKPAAGPPASPETGLEKLEKPQEEIYYVQGWIEG